MSSKCNSVYLQDQVEAWLKDKGMWKKKFASLIPISASMLSQWLHGGARLSQANIRKIQEIISQDYPY